MTPTGIKEGHTGKTGSIITTWSTLGIVISPGVLKECTEHIKGSGKNVSRDRRAAVSEHIRGTSILLSTQVHYVSCLQHMSPKENKLSGSMTRLTLPEWRGLALTWSTPAHASAETAVNAIYVLNFSASCKLVSWLPCFYSDQENMDKF